MKEIEKQLVFYDFEVTAHDWLCVIIDYTTRQKNIFHNAPDALKEYIESRPMYMGGYNVKGYDQYILKAIAIGCDVEEVKKLNDWIIGGNQGWQWEYFDYSHYYVPPQIELMHDIVPRKSLKECEGNMFSQIEESTVDFTIKHVWTKEELDEMIFYCTHDVEESIKLYELRKAYFQTKVDLMRSIGESEKYALANTNANTVAKYLGGVKYDFDPAEQYEFPSNIDLSIIPSDIIHFYETMESKYNADGSINEDASSSYEVDIVGCPSKLGFGGLHGARRNYFERGDNGRIIMNVDAFSFYPSIMLGYNKLSRACTRKDRFVDSYEMRKDSKFNKDSDVPAFKIPALKLILNTTFGISGSKLNVFYDPLMMKSVCVHGQIFLIYLIHRLSVIPSITFIQYNTDGIMFSVDESDEALADSIVKQFESETGFVMERDDISGVYQRDVNNYIVQMKNGKIKSKGGVFSALNKSSFEANSLSIVSTAVIDYFTKGTPVDKTIMECNDISKFQMILKTGSTYNGTVHYVDGIPQKAQKVNRIYATKDTRYGQLKKLKLTDDPYIVKKLKTKQGKLKEYLIGMEGERHVYKIPREMILGGYVDRIDTAANCPEHAIIDNNNKLSVDNIDKTWYIEYAIREIDKFRGVDKMTQLTADGATEVVEIAEVKEASSKKRTKKESTNTEVNPLVLFLQKKAEMRKLITAWQLPMDGYNSHQGYEYVKAFNYKTMLNDAAVKTGMEVVTNINDVQTMSIETSDKMHMIRVTGTVTLVDIETGFAVDHTVIADGADNLDKGLYKAYTMLIKSFVQLNFLRSDNENLDVEYDGKPNVASKPATTAERATAKETVAAKKASKKQLDDIVDLVLRIRKTDSDFMKGDDTLTAINNGTLDSSKATKLLIELEEKAEEYGV